MAEKRVLITGGAGFIGSHIVEALNSAAWQAEALDNLSTGSPANLPSGIRVNVVDIRSRADVVRLFTENPWDAVVHCAAQTSVERSMKDPEMDREVNVTGTLYLLEAAKTSGVGRFVFMSSGGAIYGETAVAAGENTMPAPRNYYGMHKYVAEEFVRASGISFAILRPSNVYGPRQRADAEGGVVAIFRECLLEGRPLVIHGEGNQVRDFIHVSDVVSAVIAALETPSDVIWNIARGEATRINDLAAAMASEAGVPLNAQYAERRSGDVSVSLLSPKALLETGRWGPPAGLREGLRRMLTAREPSPATG